MSERVRTTVDDGVAEVRLTRPERRNALDVAQFTAIVHAAHALRERTDVRAVVLSAEGPDFCAGLDRDMFRAMGAGERLSATAELPAVPDGSPAHATGQRAAYAWTELPVPVIAAVQGHALGGGLQIALGTDLRIVAPDATLSVLEIVWGLVPDMGGTLLLPDLVGRDVARDLTFTGRTVSGTEAGALGLATRTAEDPRAAALATAREIAARSPHAVRAAKRLLAATRPPADQLAAEQAEIGALIASPNQREAVAARLERRAPVFDDPA
ncbi:crotonase/enoyl-CoA hydratase family protein [Pseudonocardia sp. ICBG1293]|uniref:crotonase/enoyl-CoA hydratase family protein n=1 Tax=Pseudonocardia sp. ICBG1293 TaxID=2844382 RepID=UPI001CCAE264|nr:crotonase/enoyl-CoA hydratase family protein [Pseudonocardia sp. ICBG1293]